MFENQLVSVVIPVYNVELYLEKCLDSVLAQDYENIEVLLVNDGSKDRSGVICETYAAMDHRIAVISQENQGVAVARNVGVRYSNGEYICFVDSDDIIADDYISALVRNLEENDADVSVCGYVRFHDEIAESEKSAVAPQVVSGIESCRNLLYQKKISNSPFAKLFRRSIVREDFPAGVAVGEDLVAVLRILKRANSVVISQDKLYCYRIRPGSAVRRPFNSSRLRVFSLLEQERREISSFDISLAPAFANRVFAESVFAGVQLIDQPRVDRAEALAICKGNIRATRKIVVLDSQSSILLRTLGLLSFVHYKVPLFVFRLWQVLRR